jgi:proline dehydrogenase
MASSRRLVATLSWMGKRSGLAKRFVAGDDLAMTIPVVRGLNARRIRATLDLLGEGVTRESEAIAAAKAYRALLAGIQESGVESSISIKLTQIGLAIDRDLCEKNLEGILQEAQKLENFVRIDMEGSRHTQATIDLFKQSLDQYGAQHVGIVIQAYLYRSEQDIQDLTSLGCNIRLCKGAYMEPATIAFPKKRDVDRNFLQLTQLILDSRSFAAIATHDEKIIQRVRRRLKNRQTPDSQYEFQMLFGVRRELQLALRSDGDPVRVYVPFGTQWAPYFMRRLAERPANLLFLVKNLFR